jgi:hypothetical protein
MRLPIQFANLVFRKFSLNKCNDFNRYNWLYIGAYFNSCCNVKRNV